MLDAATAGLARFPDARTALIVADAGSSDATRALASHPLVRSLDVAENLYREMAHAHRDHLPDRLVPA